MFGLVSKKKYRELEEKYRELEEKYRDRSEELSSKRWESMRRAREEVEALEQLACVMKQNATLQTELLKYKQKYADELQKRLELAERVKELEEGAGKDADNKVRTEAAGTGGTAQG